MSGFEAAYLAQTAIELGPITPGAAAEAGSELWNDIVEPGTWAEAWDDAVDILKDVTIRPMGEAVQRTWGQVQKAAGVEMTWRSGQEMYTPTTALEKETNIIMDAQREALDNVRAAGGAKRYFEEVFTGDELETVNTAIDAVGEDLELTEISSRLASRALAPAVESTVLRIGGRDPRFAHEWEDLEQKVPDELKLTINQTFAGLSPNGTRTMEEKGMKNLMMM